MKPDEVEIDSAPPLAPPVISTGGSARPGRNGEISRRTRGAPSLGPDPSTPLRSAQDDTGRKGNVHSDRATGGFTLIELLVVISIVVLLMALLLPALSRARKQARAVVCQSRQRQWGVRFAMYQADNNGRFPYAKYHIWREELDTVWMHDFVEYWPYWMEVYGGSDAEEILLCPMASKLPSAWEGPVAWGSFGKTYAFGETSAAWVWQAKHLPKPTPEWDVYTGRDLYVGSYAVNLRLLYNMAGRVKPAALPTLFDCREGVCHFEDASLDAPPPWEDWERLPGRPEASLFPYYRSSFVAINRHQGGTNVLFLDGSVRTVGLKELWTLHWHEQFDTGGPWTKAGGVSPSAWPQWMRNFKDY